jgi:hypothetical protein
MTFLLFILHHVAHEAIWEWQFGPNAGRGYTPPRGLEPYIGNRMHEHAIWLMRLRDEAYARS